MSGRDLISLCLSTFT